MRLIPKYSFRNIVAHGYGELRMELVWNLNSVDTSLLQTWSYAGQGL
jgi:uncharacterized protein with HEPN domain